MWKKFKRRILNKFNREMKDGDITMEELLNKQSKKAVVVDVRSNQEFKEGHINGAINIPEYEINKNVENILKDKETEIVVYCASGNRSNKAVKKLKQLGYKNVFNLYEGLDNWK